MTAHRGNVFASQDFLQLMVNALAHQTALKDQLGTPQQTLADVTSKDIILSITFALPVRLTHSGMEIHANAILIIFKVEVIVYQVVLLAQLGMVNPAHAVLDSI